MSNITDIPERVTNAYKAPHANKKWRNDYDVVIDDHHSQHKNNVKIGAMIIGIHNGNILHALPIT